MEFAGLTLSAGFHGDVAGFFDAEPHGNLC